MIVVQLDQQKPQEDHHERELQRVGHHHEQVCERATELEARRRRVGRRLPPRRQRDRQAQPHHMGRRDAQGRRAAPPDQEDPFALHLSASNLLTSDE